VSAPPLIHPCMGMHPALFLAGSIPRDGLGVPTVMARFLFPLPGVTGTRVGYPTVLR